MARFTFPHFEMKPKAVQPPYDKWQAVRIGMSREEVVKILGKPRQDKLFPGTSPHWLEYGYIQLPFCPHPRTYRFLIGLDDDGKVWIISDPFNGRFSHDGVPTQPELIIPAEGQVFSHYPRLLDVRWYPASGVYPITYTVEIGWFPFPELKGAPPEYEWQDDIVETELAAPYFVRSFGGAQPGRVRVRARNKLGQSPWSVHRTFRFTR